MLNTVLAFVAAFAAVFGIPWAIYIFRVPPLFSRKRLSYKLELSAPLIHESANSDSSLTVRYGKGLRKRALKDPHIARIRLSNIGGQDVWSNDFDKESPLQLDLGVTIVSILRVTNSLESMPDLTVSATENRLNVGPNLIPRHATTDFTILVDGPCTSITDKKSLMGVELIREYVQENVSRTDPGRSLRVILGYAVIAFLLFFVINDPSGAAHLIDDVGNFLSSVARGFSSFLDSL